MMPNERFKGHFEFLEQLNEAIDAALAQYHNAEEGDLEELRHLKREVGLARRTLVELCEKFTRPLGDEQRAGAAAELADHGPGEKSAAV